MDYIMAITGYFDLSPQKEESEDAFRSRRRLGKFLMDNLHRTKKNHKTYNQYQKEE